MREIAEAINSFISRLDVSFTNKLDSDDVIAKWLLCQLLRSPPPRCLHNILCWWRL